MATSKKLLKKRRRELRRALKEKAKACNCAEVAHHGPTMPGHWFGCPKFGSRS